MVNALVSRAAIEQAKGAIMTVRRCDADEAWAVLQRASQQFNIKLRELAVALVAHLGKPPPSNPRTSTTRSQSTRKPVVPLS